MADIAHRSPHRMNRRPGPLSRIATAMIVAWLACACSSTPGDDANALPDEDDASSSGGTAAGGGDGDGGASGGADASGGAGTGAGGTSSSPTDLDVAEVRSTADAHWGVRTLSLDYSVPADGMVVVSASWFNEVTPSAVTFQGAALTELELETTGVYDLHVASAAMYVIAATAGESGAVEIAFPSNASRAALTVATVVGATEILESHAVVTAQTRPSSVLEIEAQLSAPADAIAVTLAGTSASIDSIATGNDHIVYANPTNPITDFHNARTYSGSAVLSAADAIIGFAQDPGYSPPPSSGQLYDAVLLVAVLR